MENNKTRLTGLYCETCGWEIKYSDEGLVQFDKCPHNKAYTNPRLVHDIGASPIEKGCSSWSAPDMPLEVFIGASGYKAILEEVSRGVIDNEAGMKLISVLHQDQPL